MIDKHERSDKKSRKLSPDKEDRKRRNILSILGIQIRGSLKIRNKDDPSEINLTEPKINDPKIDLNNKIHLAPVHRKAARHPLNPKQLLSNLRILLERRLVKIPKIVLRPANPIANCTENHLLHWGCHRGNTLQRHCS